MIPRVLRVEDLDLKRPLLEFDDGFGWFSKQGIKFYKQRKIIKDRWYFTYGEATKPGEVVGPFYTLKGAEDFARSIIIQYFENPKQTVYL